MRAPTRQAWNVSNGSLPFAVLLPLPGLGACAVRAAMLFQRDGGCFNYFDICSKL